jgi:hypothetical protein
MQARRQHQGREGRRWSVQRDPNWRVSVLVLVEGSEMPIEKCRDGIVRLELK